MATQSTNSTTFNTFSSYPRSLDSSPTYLNSIYSSSSPYYNFRGKLPPVGSIIERKMCTGRVWIFLLLGVILFVLGLVSLGIYLNLEELTSSMQYAEILPLYIPTAAILLAGLFVSCLFWRRDNVLVLITVIVNILAGGLCIVIGVFTITHVLQPLQTFTRCRYYASQTMCQCFSPYKRDLFSLQYSQTDETKYDFDAVASCDDVENVLPELLYILAVVYCVVFLFNIISILIALLVLRADCNKRGFLGADSYEEVYTVSGSSQDQSDSEAEVNSEVTAFPQGQTAVTKNSLLSSAINSSSPSGSLLHPASRGPVDVNTPVTGSNISSVDRRSLTPQLPSLGPSQILTGQRSKTPGHYNLGKENLANHYRITKTPDRETNIRQRLSKTPDRELGCQRRYSLTSAKRLSKSCESLDSSTGNGRRNTEKYTHDGKKKGKLKDHRRKGKRAATVHTLDTNQLLLILNLQMRYLQESKQQECNNNNNYLNGNIGNGGTRRAITPQPVSQKTVIPQKIRSHTPQPRRANGRIRDPRDQVFYQQNGIGNQIYRQQLLSDGGSRLNSSANSSRRTSESSDKNVDLVNNGLPSRANGEFVFYQSVDNKIGTESYLHSQQMHQTVPNIKEGYNPYIQTQGSNNTPDKLHYVTYSDSMLNNPPSKPKSRTSVQNHFLPPQPIQRSSHQQLPPQPITRQKNVEHQLPPQPVHRGNSAFHVVDRSSKSRSPSVSSDRLPQNVDSTPRRRSKKDYADVAIRENFSLNPKPYVTKETENSSSNQNNGPIVTSNPNSNFILRDRGSDPAEILPPYSGPPSYKEYVSSCNTSVTSSLSSNPDDVYGLPRRRVEKDLGKVGGGTSSDGPYVSGSQSPIVTGNLYKLAGSSRGGANVSELNQSNGNYPKSSNQQQGMMENFQNQVQRSKCEGQEAIYSSPAKSKVKQFIVPEDYYTTINKVPRRETAYANTTLDTMPPVPPMNYNQDTSVREPEYGNVENVQLSGYQYQKDYSVNGQIGPDDKYNDTYEDVYESNTVDGSYLPQRQMMENVTYSVSTHGSGATKLPRSVKSKLKTHKKPKTFNHVSDVFASTAISGQVSQNGIRFPSGRGMGVNSQVTDSVENVHAENVGKIPCIKLNDRDVTSNNSKEETFDDDVFVDDESKLYGSDVGRESVKQSHVTTVSDTNNQNYEEINDLDLANENTVYGHVTSDLANQETDTGYMKMTLPGKIGSLPTSEKYGIAIHLTGHSTNQNAGNSPVTQYSANQNARQIPDGEDHPISDDSKSFEETGV